VVSPAGAAHRVSGSANWDCTGLPSQQDADKAFEGMGCAPTREIAQHETAIDDAPHAMRSLVPGACRCARRTGWFWYPGRGDCGGVLDLRVGNEA